MRTELFATFDKKGFLKATKRAASVGRREIGVMITVEIPDSAFDDGFLHATISVPDSAFVFAADTDLVVECLAAPDDPKPVSNLRREEL